MIGGQWAWGPMCPCYYVQIVQSFFFPFPLSQKATFSRNTKPPLSNLIYKLGNASQTGFSSLACRHEKPVDLHLPFSSKGGAGMGKKSSLDVCYPPQVLGLWQVGTSCWWGGRRCISPSLRNLFDLHFPICR